nr:hypothetical protein T01B7.1 - Caenorhabditis elegans [Caenorhabditis elegans]
MNPYNYSSIPFVCNFNDYDPLKEISIYFVTLIYQGIGLFLHLSIIRIIVLKERKYYSRSSFFQIFVSDSIESSILILTSLLNRLVIYVPQLCPVIGPYFWEPSVLLKFVYVILFRQASYSVRQF